MPSHRALVNVHLETFYIYVIFKRVFINNKLPIRGVYLTGTQKRNIFFLLLLWHIDKKTYGCEWAVSVDWHSPDCESQILMVLSSLPLAICFPSGLHATERTLKLQEVRTRINRNIEEKTGKNLLARVAGHRALAKGHDEIMYIFMFLEHLFLKKSHIFEWPVSQTLRQKHECVVNFLAY